MTRARLQVRERCGEQPPRHPAPLIPEPPEIPAPLPRIPELDRHPGVIPDPVVPPDHVQVDPDPAGVIRARVAGGASGLLRLQPPCRPGARRGPRGPIQPREVRGSPVPEVEVAGFHVGVPSVVVRGVRDGDGAGVSRSLSDRRPGECHPEDGGSCQQLPENFHSPGHWSLLFSSRPGAAACRSSILTFRRFTLRVPSAYPTAPERYRCGSGMLGPEVPSRYSDDRAISPFPYRAKCADEPAWMS